MENIVTIGSSGNRSRADFGVGRAAIPAQLLLRALPDDQQQALIAARELCAVSIIYRLLVRFQPGGAGEKSLLLAKLTTLDVAKDIPSLTTSLRSWRRHYTRAREVGATVPDGTLLLQALEDGVKMIAVKDSQASFRLAQSRSQLQVDENPTQERVWKFSQCLLAEAETLALMMPATARDSKPPHTPARVKQLQGSPDGKTSPGDSKTGKGTAVDQPCRYFASASGCRAGKQCRWQHNWDSLEDRQSRCWLCGSTEHRKSECKLKQGNNHGKGGDRRESADSGGGTGGRHGGPGTGRAARKLNSSSSSGLRLQLKLPPQKSKR